MLTVSRAALLLAGTASLLAATACSAPTINGFTVTSGPASVTISPGGTAQINVAATSTSSTPITAAVIVYNLPYGVSTTPAAPTVTTGATQSTIILSAAPYTQPGTSVLQISGYSGLAASDSRINLTVVAAAP